MGLDGRLDRLRARLNAAIPRSAGDPRERLARRLELIMKRQNYDRNPDGNESVATLVARVLGNGSRLECAALRRALAERNISESGRKLAHNALRLRGYEHGA